MPLQARPYVPLLREVVGTKKRNEKMTPINTKGTNQMTDYLPTWSELFPKGRDIYYEGEHPQQFVREIATEFGFDPSADPYWGVDIPADEYGGEYGDGFTSYSFRCPAEHLDDIYGSGRWPMGS